MSAIGRFADEGVVPGTFYNAGGVFLSAEKMLNHNHSITLTAWCNPRRYANGKAVVQEIFDLTGDHLYNPTWGWQDGKKRSDNIRENFDPTVMLNWLYKTEKTTLNTGVAFRWVHFARTRLSYFKGNDTRPDYYKNLPSYYLNPADNSNYNPQKAAYYDRSSGATNEDFRQLDWEGFYHDQRTQQHPERDTPLRAAARAPPTCSRMENSNQFNFIAGSTINQRLNDCMTLQGGVNLNYTKTADFATVKDLLGGQFWV